MMKKNQIFLKLLLVLSIFSGMSTGCFNKSISNSVTTSMTGDEIFLITKKGEKIKGLGIKVNRSAKNNDNIILDGKDYPVEDVLNYQSKNGFFTNFDNNWYQRIHEGTIEAYIDQTTVYRAGAGSTNKTSAYMSKKKGELKTYTPQNLYELISDNKSALDLFNANYSKINDKTPWDYQYKKLLSVLTAYK